MIVSSSKAAEAASILNLDLQDLTRKQVEEHFRRYAKDCHPDYHGTLELERWSRISWAKEVLGYWLAKRPQPVSEATDLTGPPCSRCRGAGRLPIVSRGFGKPLTVQCAVCKGLGTIIAEENDID